MGVRSRVPTQQVEAQSPKLPARRESAVAAPGHRGGVPAHDFARIPVDSPPRPAASASPIQPFSVKGAARTAAGHVGGAARDYFARKAEPFRNAAKGLHNLRAGAENNPLGALRVGLGILGLPRWMGALGARGEDAGADAREVFRDQWEEHFSSLPPEAQAAARERYKLHPRQTTSSAGSDGGGKGCCSKQEGQVPGAGAKPPESSFEKEQAPEPPASSQKEKNPHEG